MDELLAVYFQESLPFIPVIPPSFTEKNTSQPITSYINIINMK
jgi:hypothetical protein